MKKAKTTPTTAFSISPPIPTAIPTTIPSASSTTTTSQRPLESPTRPDGHHHQDHVKTTPSHPPISSIYKTIDEPSSFFRPNLFTTKTPVSNTKSTASPSPTKSDTSSSKSSGLLNLLTPTTKRKFLGSKKDSKKTSLGTSPLASEALSLGKKQSTPSTPLPSYTSPPPPTTHSQQSPLYTPAATCTVSPTSTQFPLSTSPDASHLSSKSSPSRSPSTQGVDHRSRSNSHSLSKSPKKSPSILSQADRSPSMKSASNDVLNEHHEHLEKSSSKLALLKKSQFSSSMGALDMVFPDAESMANPLHIDYIRPTELDASLTLMPGSFTRNKKSTSGPNSMEPRQVGYSMSAKELSKSLENMSLALVDESENFTLPPDAPALPPPKSKALYVTTSSSHNNELFSPIESSFDTPPQALAKQLCLMDSSLFQSIKRSEFQSLSWTRQDKLQQAPRIVQMTTLFNKVAMWTASDILKSPNPKKRIQKIMYYIHVAKALMLYGNYNSLLSILGGLQCTPVHRLERTWAMVGRKDKAVFDKLSDLMSRNKNFDAYRKQLQDVPRSPCIPYLGLFLSDLTFLHEALKKERADVTKVVSAAEREGAIYHLLADIERYQKACHYDYEPLPAIQTALNEFKFDAQVENEFYEISYTLEPRQAKSAVCDAVPSHDPSVTHVRDYSAPKLTFHKRDMSSPFSFKKIPQVGVSAPNSPAKPVDPMDPCDATDTEDVQHRRSQSSHSALQRSSLKPSLTMKSFTDRLRSGSVGTRITDTLSDHVSHTEDAILGPTSPLSNHSIEKRKSKSISHEALREEEEESLDESDESDEEDFVNEEDLDVYDNEEAKVEGVLFEKKLKKNGEQGNALRKKYRWRKKWVYYDGCILTVRKYRKSMRKRRANSIRSIRSEPGEDGSPSRDALELESGQLNRKYVSMGSLKSIDHGLDKVNAPVHSSRQRIPSGSEDMVPMDSTVEKRFGSEMDLNASFGRKKFNIHLRRTSQSNLDKSPGSSEAPLIKGDQEEGFDSKRSGQFFPVQQQHKKYSSMESLQFLHSQTHFQPKREKIKMLVPYSLERVNPSKFKFRILAKNNKGDSSILLFKALDATDYQHWMDAFSMK